MRTRLAVGALILAVVAATVFAVWPVVGEPPWLSSEDSDAASPTTFDTPRYAPYEAVGFVRAALDHEGSCSGVRDAHFERWAAWFDAAGQSWLVSYFCSAESGPVLAVLPGDTDLPVWRFYEDSNRVIPLTDYAADFMRPRDN